MKVIGQNMGYMVPVLVFDCLMGWDGMKMWVRRGRWTMGIELSRLVNLMLECWQYLVRIMSLVYLRSFSLALES